MRTVIDLFYEDNEVKTFCGSELTANKPLEFFCGRNHALDFRFCNPDGGCLKLIPLNKFGKGQYLLSCRDRLLAASEDNISFFEDERSYQILRLEKLFFDTPEIRKLLSGSHWSIEPNEHGRIDCDFSVALYINENIFTSIQLFFTISALLKQ